MSPAGFPDLLRSNAFTGKSAASGALTAKARKWGGKFAPPVRARFLADDFEPQLDLHKWEDERVGYGIVAAAPAGASDADLAKGADLGKSVLDLIKRRGNAPVFRFHQNKFQYLTNHATDQDFDIAQSGIGVDALPQYLLILGGPDQVPWRVQFQLNSRRFVGRLPLAGADLDNYIDHLLNEWKPDAINVNRPVVWATDYGYPDITELIHKVVALPLHAKYAANSKILEKATLLDGNAATRDALYKAVSSTHPGIVVSASHGLIAPLDKPKEIPQRIGALVDQNHQVIDMEQLTAQWSPAGAVWYAHACCSAGSDGAREFQGLVGQDSDLGKTFDALTKAGPSVAPLPVHLLSAKEPVRAFIGHVEPTFDCTLRDSNTGQLFTKPMVDALYEQLLQQNSVGYAMQFLLSALASLHSAYLNAVKHYQASDDDDRQMLSYSLRGSDLEGTVLLGDPTVVLPKLA